MRRPNCAWLDDSEFTPSVRKLWQGALLRALESGVAAYDAVFIELAHREQLSLATFDNKLLKTYPDIAKRPMDLV
jgi:predicted nucleic acid-binding protein